MLAILHFTEIMDAGSMYTLCSIVLIPINSVLNPVIYNGDAIFTAIKQAIYGKADPTATISTVTQARIRASQMKKQMDSKKKIESIELSDVVSNEPEVEHNHARSLPKDE